MSSETVLARTMVELADNLVDGFDVVDLLTTLANRCVEAFDIAAANIMLATPDGHLTTVASSSEVARSLEHVQLRDGPCLDSFQGCVAVVDHDLGGPAASQQWPRFTAASVRAGLRGADALPMRLRGEVIGVLTLFRTQVDCLSDGDLAVAQALADIATIAILQSRAVEAGEVVNSQLRAALASRVVVEQAKGMIADRQRIPIEQAFAQLRRHSRNLNLRIAEVARQITSGEIDPSML